MKKPTWMFSKFNISSPNRWGIQSESHLDMGCGSNPRNPFGAKNLIGADILPKTLIKSNREFEYIQVSTDGILPLENNSIDSISGFDFLEHLPRNSGTGSNIFITFMNESSRVLKSGGILMLVTPAFPHGAAFQDPTHVNFITEQTVHYFVGEKAGAKNLGYGFNGNFSLFHQQWVGPFSQVWDSDGKDSGSLVLVKVALRNLIGLRKFRAFVSAARKPSHLLWILEKQ